MLKVYISLDETLTIHCKGHAGGDGTGNNIVCAASSIPIQTLAKMMDDKYRLGQLKEKPVIELASGNATVSAKPEKASYTNIRSLYHFAIESYGLLEANYPDRVKTVKVFPRVEANI